MFVGEFTQAGMNRVFLEKIDGEYQGACFPFRSGFASAVLRMAQGTDGSDEIQKMDLVITSATVSEDGLRVRLAINNLRELFVHELTALGIRSRDGEPLLHPHAYYTLNRIPGN